MHKNNPILHPFIDHSVSENVISYGLSSCGYDIRLSENFFVFKADYTLPLCVDPKNFDKRLLVEYKGSHCVIPPNSFILGVSLESFIMPNNLFAECRGKSTYARCGINVNTTPIEPGWSGYLTIEIANMCPVPVKVYANEGIAQVIFFKVYGVKNSYISKGGRYNNISNMPMLPK